MVFSGVLLIEGLFVHGVGRRSMLNKVRDRVGSELRTKLVAAAPEIKIEIRSSIDAQFKNHADKLLEMLQAEIKQITARLDNALADKRKGKEAVGSEMLRLGVIEANLNGLFKQINYETYGRDLTAAGGAASPSSNPLLSENT